MPEQKTGRRLIFADGTTVENGRCGFSDGALVCWVTGYSMQNAATIFFNPEQTNRIEYEYGEMKDVHEGFTNCVTLMINSDGMISVCLTRGD